MCTNKSHSKSHVTVPECLQLSDCWQIYSQLCQILVSFFYWANIRYNAMIMHFLRTLWRDVLTCIYLYNCNSFYLTNIYYFTQCLAFLQHNIILIEYRQIYCQLCESTRFTRAVPYASRHLTCLSIMDRNNTTLWMFTLYVHIIAIVEVLSTILSSTWSKHRQPYFPSIELWCHFLGMSFKNYYTYLF